MEVIRQEARLRAEREALEKEKRMLMGTASSQDSQVILNLDLKTITLNNQFTP